MNRGERIANRTKSAIKQALLELIREKNYPDITVGEITKRGDVGRSTLYRHYQSKADILVDIHRDIFEPLFSVMSSRGAWHDPQPPTEWVVFLEKHQRLGRNPFSLSYKLGNDLDYLVNNINGQLAKTIEEKLRDSYTDEDCSMPLELLAQSVCASYSGLIISWFTKFQSIDAYSFAGYIHRILGALIREAVGGKTD